jgi:hypothetical protein
MRALVIAASIGFASIGCAHRAAAPVAKISPSNPAIVHVVSRDQTLTISSGPSGLLYSLRDGEGKVMIADATPSQFAELQPELYRNVQHYIAVHNDENYLIVGEEETPVPIADRARE